MHHGWTGVRLDGAVDWGELADLVAEGYRMTAPKRLVALLDRRSPPPRPGHMVEDRSGRRVEQHS